MFIIYGMQTADNRYPARGRSGPTGGNGRDDYSGRVNMSLPNTHLGAEKIRAALKPASKLRFLGIGGVSMCSLARVAKADGYIVTGYDRAVNDVTRALCDEGIRVDDQPDVSAALDADMIVYTVAIPEDHPEYASAAAAGKTLVSRADFLGAMMYGFKNRIGFSGMHGKSTTTSMAAKIFTDAGHDPTVNCGAVIRDFGASHREGASRGDFIFEACEYMDSFLDFYPTVAVVLNIELEHVDYFKSLEQIRASFRRFIELTPEKTGVAVINAADENVVRAAAGVSRRIITISAEPDVEADFTAENVVMEHGCASFALRAPDGQRASVRMRVPGRHIICDALAAAAAAYACGIEPAVSAAALSSFSGAARRMEPQGKTPRGADVYTDYAHHPTEITTTLAGASAMDYGTVWCVFQPHTYSRTAALFGEFVEALGRAGRLVLADIYSARETDDCGVSSEKLAAAVPGAVYIKDFAEIADYIRENASGNDAVIVMGAGDIDALCPMLTAE